MAELDKIPQQTQITIETVKLPDDVFNNISDLNNKINQMVGEFGQMYLRKREISEELLKIEDTLETAEDAFKGLNLQLKEAFDNLDDIYPQGRINIQDGTIQYQPGAPTRKQLAEQQAQQSK